MRQILLIFSLFCASYLTVNAQTNTWTGAGANTNWNTVANWSSNAVPTASNDVVIPTGFTVVINVSATTKSIVVQGNSTLNISNSLSFLNASSFATNVTVNWSTSSLIGGGTLTNNGVINLTSNTARYISGGTTLNNNGTVAMPSGGTLNLYDTSVFNNTSTGVFDFQSDAAVSYAGSSHNFVNAGLIKKTAGDGTSYLSCLLTNTGTISVEHGTISMNGLAKNFNGGIYNVSTDSALLLATQVNVNGELKGTLNGPMNWANTVSVATASTFNFTGTTHVTWSSGRLLGGGALTNRSTISLVSNTARYITGGTTLNNNGTVAMPAGGSLNIYDTSVFNNASTGVFDFQSDATVTYAGNSHNFVNAGLIRKTAGGGTSYLNSLLTNTGTISVEHGSITMGGLAKIFDGGVYNVSKDSALGLEAQVNVNDELTGALNGPMNWANTVSVTTASTFNFIGTAGVTWSSGSLLGGGVLTNRSTISLVSNTARYISGEDTTLQNNGIVNMPSGGSLNLLNTSVFNNTSTGVFDFKSDAVVTYAGNSHNFVNAGLIKKTAGGGTSYLNSLLTNTGTISVELGSITMGGLAKIFDGGVYNVSKDSALGLEAQVNVNDELTGALNGRMNWANTVSVATASTFNFTGTTGVTWSSGSLLGGGVLTNRSTISLVSNTARYISGEDTTLVNTGYILFPSGGSLNLYNNVTLDNQDSGVIDFQEDATISYAGNGAFSIINSGLITKTGGAGVAYIYPPVTNSGTIDANSGRLTFTDSFGLTNTEDGIIKGTANITIPSPAKFTNDGTFAPGGSPGTLTVLGNYKSSATSVLDVELNGLVQGTGYDHLAITGTNVIFNGRVNVTLNFAPPVNAEFIVATTSGTISTCTLATTTSTEFEGKLYTFNVSCRNDKQVVLRLQSVVLGIDDFELAESSIKLYPNPVQNLLTIKNTNNLELESGQIIDFTGKVITTYDLKNMGITKEISMENYASGMYFLKINGANGAITKRIVKE